LGESRLEKGLRAAAWTVIAITVVALLAVGLFVQASGTPVDLEPTKDTGADRGSLEDAR
jgi:hypothetical protein